MIMKTYHIIIRIPGFRDILGPIIKRIIGAVYIYDLTEVYRGHEKIHVFKNTKPSKPPENTKPSPKYYGYIEVLGCVWSYNTRESLSWDNLPVKGKEENHA
jgi:hypothetical protein